MVSFGFTPSLSVILGQRCVGAGLALIGKVARLILPWPGNSPLESIVEGNPFFRLDGKQVTVGWLGEGSLLFPFIPD